MAIENHMIKPDEDVVLAMIEGSKVEAFCGITFAPRVQVGTSGSPAAPGAPRCERCETARGISAKWSELADQRDQIQQEMDALNTEHRVLREVWRESREEQRELVGVAL